MTLTANYCEKHLLMLLNIIKSLLRGYGFIMSYDQSKLYEKVMKSISSEDEDFIFLDVPGETGKTGLINLLLAE